ncbi:MAG: proprotein convertase P, partial [Winogradskyella sp.]|nr:proprotein convertase P [Winogradskyella sp.]
MKTKLHFVLSITMFLFMFSTSAQENHWVAKEQLNTNIADKISNLNEKHFLTYELNFNALKEQLQGAPIRSVNTTFSNTVIYLPNEYGKVEPFRIVEAPVLSLEQSERYPNIKTYQGFSVNHPGTRARFSIVPQGVQVMISYPDKPATFVVPMDKGNASMYLAYNRQTRVNSIKDFECLTTAEVLPINTQNLNRDANDQLLRTFRIAISTTGEYTNFWDDGDAGNGSPQEDALAQVVSTLNRMNEVFEVDMAVTFSLVNGTEIIYPDPATDPYSGNLNGQVQNTLTAEVGEANYDIGHLFTFAPNNGNAGCIGCVCVDGQKGSAFSAHEFTDNDGGPYMSDFFDIDYVPHEVGHQMGANHTFSFSSEGTGVNAEPGSGTTIMGYAGITGGNDVQDHSDPYFHYNSIDQILNNLITQTCWVGLPISNNPPVADAGSDYTIPTGTAFVLKGNATDGDVSDVLTYTWEQIDDGVTTTGNFGPNKTSGAVWRSQPPSTSPDRYMPIIERVIAGELTETNPTETVDNSSWETVSNVGRTLNFALTVRDRTEANGIGQEPQSDFDTVLVTVDAASGPFIVTSQDTSVTWDAGSTQIVTWDVAGTDSGAVNAANVNILLSVDGGFTFPFVMASGVPNDGSQDVTVPITGGDTSLARVKVEASDNIFYAINTTNFTIQESEFVLNLAEPSIDVCTPDDAVYNFTYNTFLGFTDTTTFSASGLPAGTSAVFSPPSASANGTNVTVTVSGIGSLALGNYPFTLVGTSGSITKTADVEFNVFDTNLADLTILTPADGATDVPPDSILFTWDADSNAAAYEIDIATDAAFTTIVSGAVVNDNSYEDSSLNITTTYFWRVRGVNDCASGNYTTASFTTANIACGTYNSADTPVSIPDANANGANSIISVPDVSVITDVNVVVNITHSFDGDLILTLISPDGTSILLSEQNGGAGDNYGGTTFDSDAPNSITTGSAPFSGVYSPEGDLS